MDFGQCVTVYVTIEQSEHAPAGYQGLIKTSVSTNDTTEVNQSYVVTREHQRDTDHYTTSSRAIPLNNEGLRRPSNLCAGEGGILKTVGHTFWCKSLPGNLPTHWVRGRGW